MNLNLLTILMHSITNFCKLLSLTFQSCLENPTSISKPVNLYIFSSEQMMLKLIEGEQKVKNLEPTRQQHRGLSDENKAITMYVHVISSYKHHPYM
jgi:hypothetical protein